MKKLVLLLLIFFCFTCVYAECSENQIIIKLSSKTDAHGEILNNYPVNVCYNLIFGKQGRGDRVCDGSNRVISLSGNTNAHASASQSALYPVDVCYDDLVCSARTSCNAVEKMVVSLSDSTNAHLSNESGYGVKICCSETVVPLGEVSWRNMIDQPIESADLNDSVKLVVTGAGFSGKEINYTIYKSIWWWFDKKMASASSYGYTLWRAGMKADGSFESGDYYFTAEASDGSTERETSPLLSVSNIQDNQPPVAVVIKPDYGRAYKRTLAIDFLQGSYDVDDLITTRWDFGDESQSSVFNTTHIYTNDGQRRVVLNVIDERGEQDSDWTSILVCGGGVENSECMFADIAKPEKNAVIIGREVEFNASSSYALRYTPTEVSCLGGLCPMNMEDETSISGTPNWSGFGSFNFNWRFLERGNPDEETNLNANGWDGSEFTKLFRQPTDREHPHRAIVVVTV